MTPATGATCRGSDSSGTACWSTWAETTATMPATSRREPASWEWVRSWTSRGTTVTTRKPSARGAAHVRPRRDFDSAGDDIYDCATIGQGGATTLGLGILSDLSGNDSYPIGIDTTKSTLGQGSGFGQGGALSFRHYPWNDKLTAYGGVGILNDASGDDRYESHGWCDQGGSYILSLGVLNDGDGNDHYLSRTGLGSGIHVTNAILIDRNGNDIYEGVFRSGGSGGDRSPGFLIDYHGNDVYKSESSSFGTGVKPFSCSLLIDYEGDDVYQTEQPKGEVLFNCWDSFGGVWPESEPYLWPYAIHLDLGGNDDYRVRNRANNCERISFGHGIQLDSEWKGGDVIGRAEAPFSTEVFCGQPDPITPIGLDATGMAGELMSLGASRGTDVFYRFSSVGAIVEGRVGNRVFFNGQGDTFRFDESDIHPGLLRLLRTSECRPWNHGMMECLQYFLTRRQIGPDEVSLLRDLLRAPDEEVRAIVAFDLGYWKFEGCDSALVATLQGDHSPRVRRSAADALTRLKSKAGLDAARTQAVTRSLGRRAARLPRYLGVMGREATRSANGIPPARATSTSTPSSPARCSRTRVPPCARPRARRSASRRTPALSSRSAWPRPPATSTSSARRPRGSPDSARSRRSTFSSAPWSSPRSTRSTTTGETCRTWSPPTAGTSCPRPSGTTGATGGPGSTRIATASTSGKTPRPTTTSTT